MTNSTTVWVVRTPYLAKSFTFGKALNHFMQIAASMGITITWRNGKGKSKDGITNYHYWEIEKASDTLAFYMACGDQMIEHTLRKTENDNDNDNSN